MNLNLPLSGRAPRAILGGAAALGAAGLCALRLSAHAPVRAQSVAPARITVAAAKYQPPTSEAMPIVIAADALQHGGDDPGALKAVQDAIRAIVPETTAGGADAAQEPKWMLWGRLRTPSAPVSVPAEAGISAYATHSAQGMTLCLVNRSTEKKELRLQIRLPRGVYKGERLTFSPQHPIAQAGPGVRSTPTDGRLRTVADDGPASPSESPIELERLQGRMLNASAVLRKPCVLLPGQVALFRYTDVAQAARAALNETYDSLHVMALKSPGPARRLRHILEEGDGQRGSLSPGNGKSGGARLSGIHRLLLLTAQVQSMQRNYQQRRVVDADEGAAVMGALERLTDALAETSAALLELTPQIRVQEESAPASPAPDSTDALPPARRLLVTVSLANLGRESPGMVKLGLDTAALPRGVVCEPDDPAYFGSVHPGQSVRAVFRVRCPAGTALPTDRCGGDVSYFVSGAPAHLRLRAW